MSNQPSVDGMTENNQPQDSIDRQPELPNNDSANVQLPLAPDDNAAINKQSDENGITKMSAFDALMLLSANLELLVRLTGDIPPTPPPKSPTIPQHMSGMQAEKENIARTHSDKNLAKLRKQAEMEANKENKASPGPKNSATMQQEDSRGAAEPIDGVRLKEPSASPSPPAKPPPYIIIGADSQPINLQHGLITRKFYSKNEPPISINQYLLRLHQFCPMSTAVYLAASLYIHRLAVVERAIPVTRRNAHRLVLAGLRVAMKALEDLSYPHAKMSKVGGVSGAELARLEISFCFLANFELVVDTQRLQEHYYDLTTGAAGRALGDVETTVPLLKKPRERHQIAG
ncbi:cyclin-domain-containing protein [Mariannaea sp. PMI_226]|nr:cyclin-domain-containing protein [Mariannaea sp. PMI_226]